MQSISREQEIAIAKSMGEDFAKARGEDLITQFLCETGIIDDLYADYKDRLEISANGEGMVTPERFLELMKQDYGETFNRVLAAAYAIGHLDATEEIRANIYRPKKKPLVQAGEKPSQLILPGMPE